MPLGQPDTLSDQEVWDIAGFVNSHPRPQDPRYDGDFEETVKRFHGGIFDYYGTLTLPNGKLLGEPRPRVSQTPSRHLHQKKGPTMSETLFSKIINREIPADIVYEDDLCLAFRDVNPQAPMHVLLVPKKPLARLAHATEQDKALLGHMMLKASEIARAEGYRDDFRLVINNGPGAGQSVFHLHIHILAGRGFNWPPG
jgi:histidine triad (HIT) family protein